MGETLELTASRSGQILRDTINRFQIYFPKYIESTKVFEERLKYPQLLSKKLISLYNEKNIELDKLGVLDKIGLQRKNIS